MESGSLSGIEERVSVLSLRERERRGAELVGRVVHEEAARDFAGRLRLRQLLHLALISIQLMLHVGPTLGIPQLYHMLLHTTQNEDILI